MKSWLILLLVFFQGCSIVDTIPPQDDEQRQKAVFSVKKLYDVVPDVANCYEGVLKNGEKLNALNILNKIRALHHLKPVTYNYEDDNLVSKASLISVANNTIKHDPSKNSECFTEEGAIGCKKSNLHIDYDGSYEDSVQPAKYGIMRFLVDDSVKSLGHRRWVLDPFLKEISYGRVDGKPKTTGKYNIVTSVTLKVINKSKQDISNTDIEYVAYPYEKYPSYYFKHGWFCSFSVVSDKTESRNNSNIDYSHAKITVTDEKGHSLYVNSISYNNNYFGLPNIIQWKISNTKNNARYSVKIENILIN